MNKNELLETYTDARTTGAIERFFALYPDRDEARLFSAPGRTEIGGNHTDHNHGRVLAAAVDLDALAVAAPRADDAICVYSEGFGAIEASAAVNADEEKHEKHLGTLHDARQVLQAQGCIEMFAALLMQGSYLCIDIMQGVCMGVEKPFAPSLEARQVPNPAYHPHDESVFVSPVEEIEGNHAEDDDECEHDAYRRVEGKVACRREGQVKEDRREPEPEVREDMHHRVKDDR